MGVAYIWNLKVILVVILVLLSSFISLGSLETLEDEPGDLLDPGIDTCEKESTDTISDITRAPSRPSLDDAHGGEWLDSFEDESGVC